MDLYIFLPLQTLNAAEESIECSLRRNIYTTNAVLLIEITVVKHFPFN